MFYCKNGSSYFSSNKLRGIRIVHHGFSKSPSKHSNKEYISSKKWNTCQSREKASRWGCQSPAWPDTVWPPKSAKCRLSLPGLTAQCLILSRGLRMVECLLSCMALNFSLPCGPVCVSVCSSFSILSFLPSFLLTMLSLVLKRPGCLSSSFPRSGFGWLSPRGFLDHVCLSSV